jgi:hypothetical protein
MQGIRPNHGRLPGVPLAAVMPANFYKALVPSDLDAIIAYLRSVKTVRNEVPKPKYTAPVSREPYPDAEQGFDAAKLSDPVSNGRYLRPPMAVSFYAGLTAGDVHSIVAYLRTVPPLK